MCARRELRRARRQSRAGLEAGLLGRGGIAREAARIEEVSVNGRAPSARGAAWRLAMRRFVLALVPAAARLVLPGLAVVRGAARLDELPVRRSPGAGSDERLHVDRLHAALPLRADSPLTA